MIQLSKHLLHHSNFAEQVFLSFLISLISFNLHSILISFKFICCFTGKVKLRCEKASKPPGPRPLPLIGSAHFSTAQSVSRYLTILNRLNPILCDQQIETLEMIQIKWPAQYGDIYTVKLGPVEAVNISSPKFIEVSL